MVSCACFFVPTRRVFLRSEDICVKNSEEAIKVKETGIVAACGNALDIKLNTTVMPFIIRGVKLWGINSVNTSIKRREFIWNEATNLINFELLNKSIKEIKLEELIDIYPKMLKGETSGRYIVDLNK